MTCPFSNARVPGVEDGGGGGGGGRLLGTAGGRMWERGTSIDTSSSGGSPVRQLGSVQERVNSYTRMTRSPSEPVAVRRKASGGAARRGGDVRARFKGQQEDGDDGTPLLTPSRDPPDPKQPLSIQNLTEAVWCFITIPVSRTAVVFFVLITPPPPLFPLHPYPLQPSLSHPSLSLPHSPLSPLTHSSFS